MTATFERLCAKSWKVTSVLGLGRWCSRRCSMVEVPVKRYSCLRSQPAANPEVNTVVLRLLRVRSQSQPASPKTSGSLIRRDQCRSTSDFDPEPFDDVFDGEDIAASPSLSPVSSICTPTSGNPPKPTGMVNEEKFAKAPIASSGTLVKRVVHTLLR